MSVIATCDNCEHRYQCESASSGLDAIAQASLCHGIYPDETFDDLTEWAIVYLDMWYLYRENKYKTMFRETMKTRNKVRLKDGYPNS